MGMAITSMVRAYHMPHPRPSASFVVKTLPGGKQPVILIRGWTKAHPQPVWFEPF